MIGVEHRREHIGSRLVQPGELLGERSRYPPRSVPDPIPRRVFADREQDLKYGVLDSLKIDLLLAHL